MKALIHLLYIPILSVVLLSCGDKHFLKEEAYRNQVLRDFEQKQQDLPNGDLFDIFSNSTLTLAEREALMFLYAYMPIGDLADYSGEYYLENVRLSQQARGETMWGKTIPDELFRHFVLPIRVNNENMDNSRQEFYEELKDRVKHLPMKEAILEVNHWCHEKVVYRSSDARTSSPLASVRSAFGRCGEESTFTVAALRSVGIPARQVYTPRWAHTDDNHAWVEAWADGNWYFMGACEPEPVLNLGWFNAPASRGMLMHTKVFGRYAGPEEIMLETPNYTEINVIGNYAPTAKATITVVDEQGKPVAGARVEFKVYNYAEFYTVADKRTDASGRTSLTAGKGDMLVWASDKNNTFGYTKLSFGKDEELTVALDKKQGDAYSVAFDLVPPVENANLPEVNPELRTLNDLRLAEEDSIRNAYVSTMMSEEEAATFARGYVQDSIQIDSSLHSLRIAELTRYLVASRGNYKTLTFILSMAADWNRPEDAFKILSLLSEKDLRDVGLIVLVDNLRFFGSASNIPEAYLDKVYGPRVANELVSPYRDFFDRAVTRADAKGFRENPQTLVTWCKNHISIRNELNSQSIPIFPAGVWRSRVADEKSRDIFFVSFARALGIPAWIDQVTGKVAYQDLTDSTYENGRTIEVDFESTGQVAAPTGILKASYRPVASLSNPKYYSHFTISKFKDGTFQLLNYDEGDVDMGSGASWQNLLKNGTKLESGYYMMVTGTRLASGAVLSNVTFFTIEQGKTTDISLVMRESKDQVKVIGNFNSESLYCPLAGEGKANQTSASCGTTSGKTDSTCGSQSLLQTCGRGYFIVGVLGVGQEPTNHALRDIAALSSEFDKWGRKMVFLFPSEEQYMKYRPSEFPGLPSTISYGIDIDNSIQKQIAESMKLPNQTILPMFIIADTFNRVVFVSQGYTIGLGEQLMKVIHGL